MFQSVEKISIFGNEVYLFGLFVMIGAVTFAAVLAFLSRACGTRKGTAAVQLFFSLILGGIVSRIGFCLMNRNLGETMRFSSWAGSAAGGGWSMFGLIAGVLCAAWLTASAMNQKASVLLDNTVCALPLFVVAERFAEQYIPDFNTSRPLSEGDPFARSFLAIEGTYDTYLRTYYLCAAAALVLFFLLLIYRQRKGREDGDTALAFLMLFGAGAIILESLRYDSFLSISFVKLQQVLAAVMLFTGVVIASSRAKNRKTWLRVMAPVLVLVAAGICVWIEFAIDRSDINHYLLYGAMLLTVAVPTGLGFLMLGKRKEGNRETQ